MRQSRCHRGRRPVPRRSRPTRLLVGLRPTMACASPLRHHSRLRHRIRHHRRSNSTPMRSASVRFGRISSRIDADIRMGPTAHHRAVVSIVPAAAAIIVLITGLLSYRNLPFDRTGETATRAEIGADAVLAFSDSDSVELVGRGVAAASSLVPMTVAGCGPIAELVGIAVAPDRLIGRASFVTYDVHPVVTLPDGTVRMATVIGIDRDLDLAVIELDAVTNDAATSLSSIPWGSVDQLFSDPNVVVVEGHGETATMIATRQVGIDGIVGDIDSFELEDTGFTPGAPVLNRRGLLVGLVDASGNHATGGAQLQRTMGRLVLSRPMATAACPDLTPPPPDADSGTGD